MAPDLAIATAQPSALIESRPAAEMRIDVDATDAAANDDDIVTIRFSWGAANMSFCTTE